LQREMPLRLHFNVLEVEFYVMQVYNVARPLTADREATEVTF
jgi:hypothetical protein